MEKLIEHPKDFKAGYVALLGRPNVGKSTLLNQLLQFKLSIVSKKPQTTRRKILGILNSENYQIIFLDTPGIISPRYNLQTIMMKYVQSAMEDADILTYLVDASQAKQEYEMVAERITPLKKPVILLLNKIDLIHKDNLLPVIEQYSKVYDFNAIIPISALKSQGIDEYRNELLKLLPYNPPFYPPEYLTDKEERFFVAEIIREKIFDLYGEEIPYSTHVDIEEFTERPGKKDYIRAVIYVEKSSQKAILIGKQGQALKRVGSKAREEIEIFLDRPVYLELFVKVMEDWRRRNARLKQLGYS